MTASRSAYPAGVPGWLVNARPSARRRVLDIGSGRGGLAVMVADLGHEMLCVDQDVPALRRLSGRLPNASMIAGQVESLPFDACHFDVVTASQNLHVFAPGLALAEIARVLVPGGHLGIAYNTRDDTVPWVKKLITLMQASVPESMRGDFGIESVRAVTESPYFTDVVRKDFRNWIPITRLRLLDMVINRAGTAELSPDARGHLLSEVGGLYDTYARSPEPLLLPFRASCWRATVDHTELTLTEIADDALEISLTF